MCAVYISVYIGIYISIYNGQRKEACEQCALQDTVADDSHFIPIHISIYTNISLCRGRKPVCSVHSYTPPLTAAGIPIHTSIYADMLH